MRVDGRDIGAHRIAWAIERNGGQLPPSSTFICHHCDNPPCVRPDHLFSGTALENNRDCNAKGRRPRLKGTECPWSRVHPATVLGIWDGLGRRETHRDLAMRFGVSTALVQKIREGRAWRVLTSTLAPLPPVRPTKRRERRADAA